MEYFREGSSCTKPRLEPEHQQGPKHAPSLVKSKDYAISRLTPFFREGSANYHFFVLKHNTVRLFFKLWRER
jgi:hypothetical protein